MTYDSDDLTEAQKKVVTEAESAILRIFADTRERLARTGIDFHVPEEGDFSCTQCECERYMRGGTPDRPSLVCKRQGCGHSFLLHRVF